MNNSPVSKKIKIMIISFDWVNMFENDIPQVIEKMKSVPVTQKPSG